MRRYQFRKPLWVIPFAAATLIVGLSACSSSGGSGGADAASAGNSLKVWSDEASLIAAAKKEGSLNVYEGSEYSFFVNGFEKAYPWAKVNSTALEPADATAKWNAELSAGVHNVDVIASYITQVKAFADKNAVAAVEVPNNKNLETALQDPNHLYNSAIVFPYVLAYNTKQLSGGPADLKDLGDPQWSGKLAMDNPALGGPSGLTFAAEKQVLGSDWESWLKAVAANKPDLTDSGSTSYEAVLRGDRPLCICSYHDIIGQAAGAPVAVDFYNQSSTGVVSQVSTMLIAAKAPHPAMAALWVNWIQSQDGQLAVAGSGRSPVVPNIPGADKVAVPPNVKVADANALAAYQADPTSYITEFKTVFGN